MFVDSLLLEEDSLGRNHRIQNWGVGNRTNHMILKVFRRFSQKLFLAKQYEGMPGVWQLLLNNPKEKNALSKDFLDLLETELDIVSQNFKIRAAIIESSCEGTFCAGANLKQRLQLNSDQSDLLVQKIRRTFHKILHLPFPVISVIDGWALGGGLELALNTDIRIATKNAGLGLVQTKWAILPGGGGTQTLPRIIGLARAKQLIFTARILKGKEALDWGLVSYCEQGKTEATQRALGICKQILNNGAIGVRMAKNAINYGAETDLKTGLQIQRLNYLRVIKSEDRTEGMRAFIEKRSPKYKGQ